MLKCYKEQLFSIKEWRISNEILNYYLEMQRQKMFFRK